MPITRRGFLKFTGGVVAGCAASAYYVHSIEPHWVRVESRPLSFPNLPGELVGRTVLQLSDIHVGPMVDPDYLAASIKLASSLQADLTVITGDFMSTLLDDRSAEVARLLERLKLGPLGAFAVLGNHDYGASWAQLQIAEALVRRLNDLGIRVLRNEFVNIDGLQLVGIDDIWSPNFDPQQVVPLVNQKLPTLTLCHNPDGVDVFSMAKLPGWVLSGHTHGGQVKPPFLPPPVLPVENKRYTYGEFKLSGGRRLYINCGLGYVRQVRLNMRPEMTLFRLERNG